MQPPWKPDAFTSTDASALLAGCPGMDNFPFRLWFGFCAVLALVCGTAFVAVLIHFLAKNW